MQGAKAGSSPRARPAAMAEAGAPECRLSSQRELQGCTHQKRPRWQGQAKGSVAPALGLKLATLSLLLCTSLLGHVLFTLLVMKRRRHRTPYCLLWGV